MKGKLNALTLSTSLSLLAFAPVSALAQDPASPNLDEQPVIDGLPAGLQPWRDPNRPDVIVLDDAIAWRV